MPQLSLKIERPPSIKLQVSKGLSVFYEDQRISALENLVASITAKRTTYLALAGVYYAGEQSYTYWLGWSDSLLAYNLSYGLEVVSALAPYGARNIQYGVLKIPNSLAGKRGKLSLFLSSIEGGEPDSSGVRGIPGIHKYFIFRQRAGFTTWEVINATGQGAYRYRIAHNTAIVAGDRSDKGRGYGPGSVCL